MDMFGGVSVTIDLNQATEADLRQVVQIGRGLANRIIESRPFNNWTEVARLPLIGPLLQHSPQVQAPVLQGQVLERTGLRAQLHQQWLASQEAPLHGHVRC